MKNKYSKHFYFILLFIILFAGINIFNVSAGGHDTLSLKTSQNNEENKASKVVSNDIVGDAVVVLDAGHGGYDSGSSSNGEQFHEKDITLSITKKVGTYLEKKGIKVIYTRESDDVSWGSNNVKDLQARIRISEQTMPDLFLSLHLNSYEDSSISGFETWIDANDQNMVRFVHTLHQQINALAYSKDRGIKDVNREPLQVISENDAPSALLELGYITSDQDLNYLTQSQTQDKLANAIGKAIVTYCINK